MGPDRHPPPIKIKVEPFLSDTFPSALFLPDTIPLNVFSRSKRRGDICREHLQTSYSTRNYGKLYYYR